MTSKPFAHLDGKVAVVTGSSSGIGRAIALEFARAGARVLVHYREAAEAAGKVVEEIDELGGPPAGLLGADLSVEAELEDFVARCRALIGEFDIWVNNAGADLLTGPKRDLDPGQKLQTLWETDVRATILLSRLVGREMQTRGGGVLLNVGWDQADRGMEGDSGELFAASKNAIMGFTRSLAVSLAPQVRVNCLAPGWIRTAWGEQAPDLWQQRVLRETPLKRWGTPDDVARMARFLASEEAAFITGQVINVNGGAVR